MNTVFVTGATGFLGKRLTMRLAYEGNRVHALYRSEEKIRGWEHENIRFFKGTLSDTDIIERAMKGCQQVYHLAAFASVWARDPRFFYEENVRGTANVLEAARKQGVERLYLPQRQVFWVRPAGHSTRRRNPCPWCISHIMTGPKPWPSKRCWNMYPGGSML